MKSPLTSSTIWVNILFALLARFWPGAREFVCQDPQLTLELVAATNALLRLKTRQELDFKKTTFWVLLSVLAFLCLACGSVPQRLDPNVFYKRDIKLTVNNADYEGISVLPAAHEYDILIEPKGGANIDLLLITTCHREFSAEKSTKGWSLFGGKKTQFTYKYQPVEGLEDDGDCLMRINSFEKDKGRHAWALIAFQHSKYQLEGVLACNGEVKNNRGVSVCQSKRGLIQSIQFPEAVRWATPPEGCGVPVRRGTGLYELPISLGECIYTADTKAGRMHRLVTVGYEGVLVREQ